jgi:nicotinate-nucleotide pyrophosphorylase (carboxylating)
MYLESEIDQLVNRSIEEEIRSGDITTDACVPEEAVIHAKIVLKQAGVIAGFPFIVYLFKKLDPRIEITCLVPEGSFQKAGAILANITGPARGILSGQRMALNILQHASGVATLTSAYVRKVAGFGCAILDTRKTSPGLRNLEKYAVRIGGGLNHRFGLDDRFIIKTDHLAVLGQHSSHPITLAVQQAKKYRPNLSIEIEIDDVSKLQEALQTDAKVIILCNMTPDEVARCVEKIRKTDKKVYVDSSGTITLDTIRAYAELGIDAISIGALTHSAPALDMSMKM